MLDPLASSRASKARFAVVVIVLLAAAFLLCASFLPVSKQASAGIVKIVRGHIYDELGNPLGGANVTIEAVRGGITQQTLWYDSTEVDGLYTVTFGLTDSLALGDTIEVTASYSSHQSTNSSIADDSGLQFIDVYITGVSIPEFGALSVVGICGAFIAVFVLVGRRRTG